MSGGYDVGLYDKYSRIRMSHAESYLAKYKHLLKWKPKESILDVGCGTGNLSRRLLYPLLPKDFSQIVCLDNRKEMLQEAKKQYKGYPKVSFELKDINGEFDDEIGKFDHIFSFYCLMWLQDQEKAFTTIHQMLAPGGACFLVILHRHAVVDTIHQLLEKPKWKKFIQDSDEVYPFPYRKLADPVKTVTEIMESVGYVNVKIFLEKTTFTFTSKDEFLGKEIISFYADASLLFFFNSGYFKSIPNPLALMTAEEQDDYLMEAVDLALANNVIRQSNDKVNGTVLVAYGEK